MAVTNKMVAEVDVVVKDASAQLNKLTTQFDKITRATKQTNAQVRGIGATLNKNSYAITNAANQFSDLFVQVAGGVNPMRALGQQLPQLLAGFSGFGVALAIVGTSLLTFAPQLLAMRDNTKDFTDAMDKAADAVDSLRSSTANVLRPFSEFRSEFGNFASEARNLGLADLARDMFDLQRAAAGLGPAISGSATTSEVQGMVDTVNQLLAMQDDYNAKLSEVPGIQGLIENHNRQLLRSQQALEQHTGMTADQAQKYLDITSGLVDMMAKGEVSGEYAKQAQVLRDQLATQGRLRDDVDAALTQVIDLSMRWLNVRDATVDAEAAASGVADETNRAAAEVRALAAAMQTALSAFARIGAATTSLANQTKQTRAEIDALAAGADRAGARAAAAIEAKRQELQAQLQSADPVIAAFARHELAEFGKEADANAQASRELDAALKGLNTTFGGSPVGGGVGGGGTASSARAASDALDTLKKSLEGYRTPAREAEVAMAQLRAEYAKHADDLKGTEYEGLFKTAMTKLAEESRQVAAELGAIGQIFDQQMSGMFDGIIDQTSTVKDAFNGMIDGILKSVAKFLLSSAVNQFLSILTQLPGFGFLGTGGGAFAGTSGFPSPFAATPFGPNPAPTGPAFTPRQFTPVATLPAAVPSRRQKSDIEFVVNNNATGLVDLYGKRSNDPDGREILELTIESKMKDMMAGGDLDRQMRLNYGIRRKG